MRTRLVLREKGTSPTIEQHVVEVDTLSFEALVAYVSEWDAEEVQLARRAPPSGLSADQVEALAEAIVTNGRVRCVDRVDVRTIHPYVTIGKYWCDDDDASANVLPSPLQGKKKRYLPSRSRGGKESKNSVVAHAEMLLMRRVVDAAKLTRLRRADASEARVLFDGGVNFEVHGYEGLDLGRVNEVLGRGWVVNFLVVSRVGGREGGRNEVEGGEGERKEAEGEGRGDERKEVEGEEKKEVEGGETKVLKVPSGVRRLKICSRTSVGLVDVSSITTPYSLELEDVTIPASFLDDLPACARLDVLELYGVKAVGSGSEDGNKGGIKGGNKGGIKGGIKGGNKGGIKGGIKGGQGLVAALVRLVERVEIVELRVQRCEHLFCEEGDVFALIDAMHASDKWTGSVLLSASVKCNPGWPGSRKLMSHLRTKREEVLGRKWHFCDE